MRPPTCSVLFVAYLAMYPAHDAASSGDRAEIAHVDLAAPPHVLDARRRATAPASGDGGTRVRGRSTDRLGQQLAGELRRRRLDELGPVLRLRGVEPNDDVEVQAAAALILRDLHVRHPHPLAQPPLGDPEQAGELARDPDRRPPPQLRRQRVPDHRPLVVKALRADRLPEPRIILVVDLAARQPDTVRAHRRLAARMAPLPCAVALPHAVHRPEARRRQRHEQRSDASPPTPERPSRRAGRPRRAGTRRRGRPPRNSGTPPRAGCRSTSAASHPARRRSRRPV